MLGPMGQPAASPGLIRFQLTREEGHRPFSLVPFGLPRDGGRDGARLVPRNGLWMAMGTYLPSVAPWNNDGLLGIPTLQYSNMAMENVIILLKPQFRVDVQLPGLSFFFPSPS